MLLQPYWAWRLRGLQLSRGDGDGLFAPLSRRVAVAWELFGPRLEVFPAGTPGPGSSPCPACRQRAAAPRAATGGTHRPHRRGAGTGVAEGHGALPLPHTRRSAPESSPLATVSAPQAASLRARGFPGDGRQRPAPSALGAVAAGTSPREAAEEKGQNKKTKNHPQP